MDKTDDKSIKHAYILTAVIKIVSGLSAFYTALYLKSIGFSGFEIGLVYAAAALTGLLSVFWAGISSDRFNIKKIIALGMALTAVYYIGLTYLISFPLVLILFVIGGIGGYVSLTALDSFALKKVENSKGKNLGIYAAIKSVGFGVGVIIGGYLLFMISFNRVLFISGIVIFLSFLILNFMKGTISVKNDISSYLADFKHKRVIMFSILLLIFTLHWGVENVNYSLFLKENLGLSFIQMGWFMAIPILFLGISSIWMGKKFDRGFSAKGLLLASFLLGGAGMFMMAITNNVYLAFFSRIIHEMGDGAFMVFVFTGAVSYFTKEKMGGNYGLVTLTTIVGAVLGSLIFSPIGSMYGYEWPNLICGAIMVVSGFFIFLFRDNVHV